MRILFCGDVVGKAGRKIVGDNLLLLKDKYALDVIVINAENASHGFGLTTKAFQGFKKAGADVLTLGNHSFDKPEVASLLEDPTNAVIRPLNYPENTVGQGFIIYTTATGKRLAVVNLLGRLFMHPVEDPFACMDTWLKTYQQGRDYDALLVDFHAEATAEKRAMGSFLTGRATLVAGTHTHIPTADAMILDGKTAYITDVGMCGDYDSVIGMQVKTALPRFLMGKENAPRLEPAEKTGTFCGVLIDCDAQGEAKKIRPLIFGTHLLEQIPTDF